MLESATSGALLSSSSSTSSGPMGPSLPTSLLLPSSLSPLASGSNNSLMTASTDSLARREKARRRTTTTQDLLYGGDDALTPSPSHNTSSSSLAMLLPVRESPEYNNNNSSNANSSNTNNTAAKSRRSSSTSSSTTTTPTSDATGSISYAAAAAASTTATAATSSMMMTTSTTAAVTRGAIVVSPPTTPGDGGGSDYSGSDEKLLMPPQRHSKKSILPRPSSIMNRSPMSQSPVLQRRGLMRSSSIGDTSSDTTPPSSPTMARRGLMSRSTDENVFSRLTSSTSSPLATTEGTSRGSIVPSTCGKSPGSTRVPLVCTHTAEGHTKAVLSVCATDQLMFTGSKDRTVKSWDLGTGRELTSYPNHPNTVIKVAFCPKRQLLFSVCQSSVRVWDVRKTTDNCIKTLSSSGLTTNGPAAFTGTGRQSESSQHEHQINDIQLSSDGQTLFCGAGNVVQIWDLRRFSQAGKLCGHQAPVMALALTKGHSNCRMVISGSKDHYIKMFDVIEDAAGILWPKHNLMPPHYDGISSLALQGSTLFSGSRDMCIKKWDINTQTHKHSINAAHKDWVCALDFVPGTNILLSGGRGGFLKLWHPDTCLGLGEIKAHNSPINAITTNSTSIFTAANESSVRIWRMVKQGKPLRPDNSGR